MYQVIIDWPTAPKARPTITEHATLDLAAARHEELVRLHEAYRPQPHKRVTIAHLTVLSITNLEGKHNV